MAKGERVRRRLKPSQIRFTQDSIANTFQNGNLVNASIPQMEQGILTPEEFIPIRVVNINGKIYSMDNRRLYLFRVGEYQGYITDIPVKFVDISKLPEDRFTTTNDGIAIRVRKDKTRNHYRKTWLLEFDDADNRNLPPATAARAAQLSEPIGHEDEPDGVVNRGYVEDHKNKPRNKILPGLISGEHSLESSSRVTKLDNVINLPRLETPPKQSHATVQATQSPRTGDTLTLTETLTGMDEIPLNKTVDNKKEKEREYSFILGQNESKMDVEDITTRPAASAKESNQAEGSHEQKKKSTGFLRRIRKFLTRCFCCQCRCCTADDRTVQRSEGFQNV